ncbi:Osmosensitive K+ channel histidine kinase KdpD [Candidatus Accumulibacter phosphatis]|uniref:histidine kinase n=2 Tax=Candidatus Accumulibacter phosphatis TaxID=327160 RepID=A0A5S4EIA7_9PROT|nr:Osmosensitive K+ channel histidine kinase KdpD [Candidatus Accumulibacter phosphatis]
MFTPFLLRIQDTDGIAFRVRLPPAMKTEFPSPWLRAPYLVAAALCTLTTLGTLPLRGLLDLANIVMIFLLTVFVAAVWLGRGPSIMAAFLGVALFDFFFVPPHLSFAVADGQYLVTFAVMLAVGLISSHLAALLSERTAEAQSREQETRVLYQLARDLGGALAADQVADMTQHFLGAVELDVTVLVADASGQGISFHEYGSHHLNNLEKGFARSAYDRGVIVETDPLAGMGVAIVFLPLVALTRVLGVLALVPRSDDVDRVRALRPLLEAVASLLAITLERLHYADAAQVSELRVSAERLRASILSSLSHDLRTPLTSLVGLADTLVQRQPALDEGAMETAAIIRDQAHAMHHLMSNLLEMARLQSGSITLNKEWQPFEEIIGSSTRLLADLLASRRLDLQVPRDLPLVEFDAVLLERVLCNLLENAAKYSPPGARIEVLASVRGGALEVAVGNDGPGFPTDRIGQVFDLFARGGREPAVAGTGLGLAICKAIVEAHGGSIVAENHPGGACVRFTLPLGTPPAMDEEGTP